ncbi:efflux RND transporter periplasmic adaptor subunit [Candidatus Nitrospira allomarina]|uniref:Efflux RND transporter periplasmic adaptor subunit n=1 Tax=Candidatus Nitrospira allomarina TaxID=3020900 RepID=A0AA96GD53_9BACT|nr:efflux RND transporter periplasmic adaptor subunit [Candidatus Nitrospira allomarina]WNM58000.1 efflux RND transporter periplasmic adaptor subunit [Candidatus Nitrospira allomarina]
MIRRIIGILLVVLTGCGQGATSPPDPPPPTVEVVTVTTQDLPDEPEFIGQTEAFRPVEIRSQVTGIIKKVFFTEGRNVKQGDRLYLIDPVPFKAAYLSAKARVTQAQARLVQARQDFARVEPLLEEQAVSQKDVDDAVAEGLAAKAALEAAQGDLVKSRFDLSNTLIVAPIGGRISKSRFYEGRLVSAQTDLMTTIDQLDPMYVNVSVPETYLLRRRRELAAHRVQRPDLFQLRGVMTFADGSVYPHEGKLDFADVAIRSETGTLQGRFAFPNPEADLSPGKSYLYPGQFVRIRLKGYIRTDAILIPQRAVQQGPKGTFVNVIGADDKVEVREVDATGWRGGEWLIEEGLQPGERIVVEGFHRIQPGMQVNPVPFRNGEVTSDSPSHENPTPSETAQENS